MDEHLTDVQRSALESLLEVTGEGCERDVAMSVLESVDWDVQKAAGVIFDHPPPPRRPRSPPRLAHVDAPMEEFEIDDGDQDPLLRPDQERRGRPTRGEAAPLLPYITRPLISILSLPFSLISSFLRFVFGILRIPFPRFTGLTFISPLRRPPTREWSPERWLRELEEETGAVSLGRLKAQGRGATSSAEAGPSGSNLTSRGNGALTVDGLTLDEGKTYLPDFLLTTYESALRETQRTSSILAVFLLSEEHDDTPTFKRNVLTNPALLTALSTHTILPWAAPTSSREGWSAAQKLGATSFPFVAFVALQPPRSSHSSSHSSTPVLTVLSRHQGLSNTTAEKLVPHIDGQVVPRVSTFLNRLKSQQRAREMERELRDQQDRAFAEAARRDRERIEARALEERRKADERRRAEEAAERAEQKAREEAEEARRREELRMDWRRWTRRAFGFSSPAANGVSGGLRIAVRLPTGSRLIHTFPPNATMTDLYAFVDANLIPPSFDASTDPTIPPPSSNPGPTSSPQALLEREVEDSDSPDEYWLFTLASAFPRVALPWSANAPLANVQEIRGGGQVVVEMISSSRPESRVSRKSLDSSNGERDAYEYDDDDDDDEYETESEDE